MSKRKLDEGMPPPKLDQELEMDWAESKNKPKTDVIKKNSLDSDEEDDGEEKNYNILDEDEIEGQEDGAANIDGEVRITPFNMKEELEEGHFDTDGNYHWNKDKVVRDNWLENIDWVKIKKPEEGKAEESDDSDDSDNIVTPFDCVPDYKLMLELMKPGETVAKAIRRLGGGKTMTASERWRRKKAGEDVDSPGQRQVAALTEYANNLLTRTGNMDIYQESYEQITEAIASAEKLSVKALLSSSAPGKSDELDMYADDFDVKEKARTQTESDEPATKKARVEGEGEEAQAGASESKVSDVIPKKEIKEELYDYYESDNSLQFDDFRIKPEEVDISDVEFSELAESEDENDHRHEMKRSSASASETLECAAKLNTLSTKNVDSRYVESLCRPCSVVLKRLDSRTKASAAAVFSCPQCNIGFTSKFRFDCHQRLYCRRRSFNEPLITTLAKKIPAAIELDAKLNERSSQRCVATSLKTVGAKVVKISTVTFNCPSVSNPPGKTFKSQPAKTSPAVATAAAGKAESRKRLKCSHCIYSTDSRTHFEYHLVTHTGERRFSCTMCKYKATRKAHLKMHLLTHGGVKQFACAECNFRAWQKNQLTIHIHSHTGEKPFKCTQCDYACRVSGALTNHVRSKHTMERPFGCTQCEYTCIQSSKLANHMLKHATGKKFSCSECGYKSNYSKHVTRHKAAKHNG